MAKSQSPSANLTVEQARAIQLAAQELPPRGRLAPVDVLSRAGYARTLGGVDVYLALRARVPTLTRAAVDRAVADGRIRVTPAVRGCIYAVPREDAGLCLRVADLLSRTRAKRDAEKAGVRPGELDKVAAGVLAVLEEHGALSTDAIRRRLPDGLVRSLGEAGKKVGLSSPLPPALRQLEFEGRIERTLPGGGLDSERYEWRIPAEPVFTGVDEEDPPALHARLAEHFFRAAGLGTLKNFAAWAGLSQRDAKAAGERIGLVPVSIEGAEEAHWHHPDRGGLVSDPPPIPPDPVLLPFEDSLIAYAGGAAAFADPEHHDVMVPAWGRGKASKLGETRHMMFRSILSGGRLAGFWEFDPGPATAAVALFAKPSKKEREAVEKAAADAARFLAEDVGHGRSFSLDTDAELAKRAEMLRALKF